MFFSNALAHLDQREPGRLEPSSQPSRQLDVVDADALAFLDPRHHHQPHLLPELGFWAIISGIILTSNRQFLELFETLDNLIFYEILMAVESSKILA